MHQIKNIHICIKASYKSITLDELEQIQTFYLEIRIAIHLLNIFYIFYIFYIIKHKNFQEL